MIVVIFIAVVTMPGVRRRFQARTFGYRRCGGSDRGLKIGRDDQQSENPSQQPARHGPSLLLTSRMDQARSLSTAAQVQVAGIMAQLLLSASSAGSGMSAIKSQFTLPKSVFHPPPPNTAHAAGSQPGAAEKGRRKMRKSLLTVIVVVTLASGAAPGLTAENTQQQRVEDYAAMPNGMSGDAAQRTFLASHLGNPPSETQLLTCTAGSAKDVALNKNKCE
jgi:hypothetical protein